MAYVLQTFSSSLKQHLFFIYFAAKLAVNQINLDIILAKDE